jgi:hypothetical protein
MGFAVSAATTAIADIGPAMAELHAALEIAARGRPDFIAVHASVAWDPAVVQAEAARVLAGRHMHGGTTCLGVMGKGGPRIVDGKGMGAFAIWDSEGDYGVASGELGDDPRVAAAQVTRAALADAGRDGEAPELIWLTCAPGREEEVVAGIMDVVGSDARILGGSAADDDVAGDWRQYCHRTLHANGIVVSVLFPSRSVSLSYQNGYVPGEHCGIATHAEGRRVYRIDDRPALDVYMEWARDSLPGHLSTPRDSSMSILEHSAFVPFGWQSGELAGVPSYLLALPAESHPDGSLSLLAEIEAGQPIQLMRGSPDTLVTRAGRVARHAAEHRMGRDRPIAGALMVFCGGLMMAIRERMDAVSDGVEEALEGAPFLGIFTFGEQGIFANGETQHANLMISCAVFEG